jgi:hypothetical protein
MTRELPAASAQAAARRADKAHEQLVAEAHRAVKFVKGSTDRIEERFYEVGEALAQLQRTEALHALGFRSFVELCRKELGLDTDLALRLVHVATKMTAESAKRLGGGAALALASLEDTGPDADTVALSGDVLAAHGALLASTKRSHSAPPPSMRNGGAGRAVPAKGKGKPAKAAAPKAAAPKAAAPKAAAPKAAAPKAAAPKAAAPKSKKPAVAAKAPKANPVTDKALAAGLQKQLRAAGLARAKVSAVKKKGRESDLSIEGLSVSMLSVLAQELALFAKSL